MLCRRFCRVLSSFLAGTLCCGGVSVALGGKKEDLGPSVVGKSSKWKKASKAVGATVGGVTLVALAYLGKLAYDVKRDVDNLFEWLDGVVGKEAIEDGLSSTRDFFVFNFVVETIHDLLPVVYQPVFSLLIRFVNKNEFVNKAESRYCNKSSEVSGYDDDLSDMIINNPVHPSKNNKVVTSFVDFDEEKLDD